MQISASDHYGVVQFAGLGCGLANWGWGNVNVSDELGCGVGEIYLDLLQFSLFFPLMHSDFSQSRIIF